MGRVHSKILDGIKPSVRLIQVKDLVVYQKVQRCAPSKNAVKRLADVFDLAAVGVLTVSVRRDGSLSLIDGQLRAATMTHLGMSDQKVQCNVYAGLTESQEAALFRRINKTRLVSVFDDFDKGVVEGDRMCLTIANICKSFGLYVGKTKTMGSITCVGALTKSFMIDGNGEALQTAIKVMTTVFPNNTDALSGILVFGVSLFIAADHPNIDTLISKVRSKFSHPTRIVTQARQLREVGAVNGTVASAVAGIMSKCYGGRKARS